MDLRLFNTLTRRKDAFKPRSPGSVQMFVCGPTVYDFSHVGHAKTYTQFDFIARYLRSRGLDVFYLMNVTDVDDKIIVRARADGVSPDELAAKYEAAFLEDMDALHISSVTQYARAHDFIPDVVRQIQTLIDKGHAYRIADGWYFDVTTYEDYGRLARRVEASSADAIARIDENPEKRHSADFALWKTRKAGEPSWNSELGPGRPGWHIEDTAITEHFFGPQYDIHGGAIDLIFPHHEAERAQMESASGRKPLATYWLHTGFLTTSGDKMSKSRDNFWTIRDALRSVDYRTLRFSFLRNHYRSELELTAETMQQARSARLRIERFVRGIDRSRDDAESRSAISALREEFYGALNDDFDTPRALAAVYDFVREQNRAAKAGKRVFAAMAEINELFDVIDAEGPPLDAEIEALVAQREVLREERRFNEADAIRNELERRNVVLEDTSEGVRWRVGSI